MLSFTPAQAWWNKDWQFRAKLTADASPQGGNITEPIGRTTILLRMHQGNFDFAKLKPDGSDLRFVAADDKTPLRFHVERFSQQAQLALVWVDIPDLAPGTATPFYLYFGNEKATDGADPRGSFDPDQLLVYHFGEENGLPKDTTGFGNNALTAGTRDEAGLIGFALRLDREKPPLRIAKNPSMAFQDNQALTVGMWVQPDPSARTSVLLSIREGAAGLTIGLANGVPYAQVDGPSGTRRTDGTRELPAEGWHHIAMIAAERITVYLDGQPVGSASGPLPVINGQAMLGASELAGTARYVGLIDELQIAKIARPLGALAAAIGSQGPDAKLVAFDQPERSDSGEPNPFVIIFRSVTVDAWVVIVLLGIMAMMSWYVMYSKTAYLNRLGKGNSAYQAAYRKRLGENGGDHMAVLAELAGESAKTMRHSSLHRLSRIAVRELDERLANGMVKPGARLAPESLAAIRASLETGQAHEQHRLSNLMVMLVVSISGGPFLGLLGTVVGVMITFAAIAAAGDVNINAIAPGIGAALLATAAGMFVAIPAMFGYNYLLLRIKDASTDMAAFVNETVTRMGEARAAMRPAAAASAEPQAAPAVKPAAAKPQAATASAAPPPADPLTARPGRPQPRLPGAARPPSRVPTKPTSGER